MSSTSRIWVTGSSEGIGLGLLQHYHRLGWQTVGSSRRPQGPHEADHWIAADLSDSAQCQTAVDRLTTEVGWPDLVILNAGVGHWAAVAETEQSDAQRVFALNYWSPVELTRLLAQRAEGRALHVVIISSIAARFGQKKLATYSASKAAVAVWAESLNEEWQGSAHRIQLMMPGVVSTGIMRHSIGRDGQPLGDRAATHRGWSTERTARAIARATRSGRFAHILASPSVRFAVILHDLCPRLFYQILRRKP
jgi:NAD(P)-dependent dehydrogenase (short-subunit alcohol dehydrogenase family)